MPQYLRLIDFLCAATELAERTEDPELLELTEHCAQDLLEMCEE